MNNSGGDNFKDRQMELLMEKLRNKANHLKPWNESIKGMRVALMDKRYVLDSTERLQLQKCLDTLQKSIKVTSIQSMVERLESITRQLGLKFTAGPSGTDCFISSDMFYVEVLLELTGTVKDVKIAHHGDPVSCSELSEVLSRGDFVEFTKHLEGLAAIYQLNADKKQKSKAYMALQALETDLSMLAQLQSSINDPTNLVHKSPVGILQPRKGGHPMKLTYFISPYDLLDVKTKSSIPLTVENVIEKQLGHCVTVCIESSTAHKLQTQSLMSISRTPDGKSLPSFAAPSNLNSTTLPASFVLKLATPMPISTAIVKKIQSVTSIECADMSLSQPLLSLITKHASGGELDCNNNKGLFVVLPDQHHCYYLSGAADLQGLMVTSIPFTHPTHVPQILVFLRQQMLFNVLISSCIRTCSKQDVDNPLVFEVTALSWLHISVSFEHPMEESMATAEFDLSDITNVKCKLYTMSNEVSICSDEYASKVVQRCLSIPVTMRAVIRKAQGQQQKSNHSNEDMFMAMGSSGKYSNQPHGFSESSSGSKFVADFDVKLGRSGNASDGQGINKLDVLSSTISTSAYGVSSPDVGSNPLGLDSQAYIDSSTSSPAPGDLFPLAPERTGGVLHSGRFSQAASAPSAQPQAKTSVSSLITEGGHGQMITKPRKGKRKTVGDSSSGSARNNTKRSPKHKLNEEDFNKDLPTPDVDSNGSLSITFGMGLELSASASNDGTNLEGESHVSKLASSLDTMIKYEGVSSRTSGEASASSDSELQTSSSSVQDILEKSGCDQSNTDSDLFNANQGRNSTTEFQFKTEPMDFDTEVLNNQSSSFEEELMDSSDDFNLEHLGINTSIISKVPLNLNIEKAKENKKKKIKLEKDQNNSNIIEEKPLPVILDIISSQEVKLIEPNKSSTVADIAEKRPNVEIIPIGTLPPSSTSSLSTSSSSSLHGSSIKIVKSDNKSGQREIRRGVSMSERSDKKSKGESKRKRKHAEALNSSDEKPTKIFELSITALPPQSNTNEKTLPVIKSSETSIPKSIMLSVKSITSPTTVTSGTSISKTQISSSKKPQLPAGTTVSPTKPISILKTSQSKPKSSSLKTSSSSSKSLQGLGSDSKSSSPGSNKTIISPIKVHNKLKSSSSSSGNSSSSSSSGNSKQGSQSPSVQRGSSPSKVSTKAATVKLKQLNIPSSTTVTPLSKSTPSSGPGATLTSPTSNPTPTTPTATPTSNLASSPSTPTASSTKAPSLPIPSSTPTSTASGSSGSNNGNNSNGGNSSSCNKANKIVNRSRKGSLSAVIDKLMASNRQNSGPPGEGSAQIPDKKSDLGKSEEKKDIKSEKKESHKESSSIQKSNDKNKSSSSDQKTSDKKPEFTVKQSSQGIKLTVTKTRSVEGSTKLSSSLKTGSSKLSSKLLSSSSLNNSRPSGLSGSATGLKPGVNSGPASKKIGSSSSNSKSSSNSSSGGSTSLSGQNKSSPVHKGPGGSGSVSKGSVSGSSFKPSPKHSSSSSSNSSTSSTLTTTTTTVTSTSTLSCTSITDSKSHMKTQEKTGKSPVHESKPSTPKGEKGSGGGSITSMPPPPPPPPPPPVPMSEVTAQSRKIEECSGRPTSVRQSPKHNRDLQPEETEAERQFRLLLAQTKMENQTTSLTTTTSSNTTKSTANSNILGSSAVDRPEGARTPKLELPDKSPKHSSSGAPKTPTGEKTSVNLVNSKPVPVESKRPSTPKSGDNPSKASDIPSSPIEPSPSSKQNLKPKTKRQASPSLDDLSSPEDNLIIDCPSTPHQKSDKKLVKSSTEPSTPITKSPPDKPTPSPLLTVKSPANPSPSLKSPLIIGTPHSDHSNPSSIAHSSPCVIDDDLMDEALVGVGK